MHAGPGGEVNSVDAQRVETEVLRVLDETLSTQGRLLKLRSSSLLLGAVPELDSMAIVSAISALQERLGVQFHDEDLDVDSFQTVGHLVQLVSRRLGQG
jgi:acyl carrier protein